MKIEPKPPNPEALFRYSVLSQVIHRILGGQARPEAIETVASQMVVDLTGQTRSISVRTIYRWLAAFEEGGSQALEPTIRTGQVLSLPKDLLDFFKQEKRADPIVSVPELIRRAQILGHISPKEKIDRTTVWRNLKRMGVDTKRVKSVKASKKNHCKRFSFPHRMDMVLCDGKHFRAGVGRHKRVALFFIDDATRFVLATVVGTSESAALFQRGLYECILHYGLMIRLFVDNGSGFIALDSIEIARKLLIYLIHGTAGYPQGRGKVERFNRTADDQVLRLLPNNPEIDPSLSALELRLRHYIQRYNQMPHESLKGKTPWQCFSHDPRNLRFHENISQLKQAFLLHEERRVSSDHIVSVAGVAYETPSGYAGRHILIYRHLLENTISLLHDGKLVRLSPVDLHDNATNRTQALNSETPETQAVLPPPGAAQMAFNLEFKPVVDAEGGFVDDKKNKKDK